MPPKLKIVASGEEREIPFTDLVTVGRSKKNDITLSDDSVSRSHAILRRLADGKYYIMDSGSTNGTFVNEKRVLVPSPLTNGDKIRLGDTALLVFQHEEELTIPDDDDDYTDALATMVATRTVIQKLTVLVADIRGYSRMTEEVPVGVLGSLLGQWFRAAGEVVEKNGGVVDKFIGDAAMVRWLPDKEQKDASVYAALRAAHDLHVATESLSGEYPQLPHPLRIGVGINTGQALLGNLGGGSASDYTALGDAVNLAFRFEEATKTLNANVVLGPDSYVYLPDEKKQDHYHTVTVKNRDEPITVCAFAFEELPALIKTGR
ncbi:MAG: FHA domain-containing protein [Kiritimatiellae bacterium]|nr:FHA domain-containing protein [Kiritimatiellia bacterium]